MNLAWSSKNSSSCPFLARNSPFIPVYFTSLLSCSIALLCCVLGWKSLFSQCFTPPRSITAHCRGNRIKCWDCNRLTSHTVGSIDTPTSRFILRKPVYGLAGWATWLEYRLFLLCLSYHLLVSQGVYRNPNSWGKQTNVEGIPKKCSSSRITVKALFITQIWILHFGKKAHSKFWEIRRGGVCYAGVTLVGRLSKDHSVSCRKQVNSSFTEIAKQLLNWMHLTTKFPD